MKRILFFTFLFILSLHSFSQQSKIDSLQKVLLTQKEDTNKVNLLNTLAIALMWNNKPDTAAISLIEQAKKISEKIKYKKGISKTQYARIEIGRIYRVHSKLNEALKQYTIASKIFEDIKDEDGVAKSYRMIASIHFEQGNYPAALRALFISLNSCI